MELFGTAIGILLVLLFGLLGLLVIVGGISSIMKSLWEIKNVGQTRTMSGKERREAWRSGGLLPPVEQNPENT